MTISTPRVAKPTTTADVRRRSASATTSRSSQQKVHGKPLVYLDNAASTQKPRAVIDALSDYYENDNANVHRGVHMLERAGHASLRGSPRQGAAASSTPPCLREIIFTRGTTEAINLVAQTLRPAARPRRRRDHHHARWSITRNIVPWQMLCQEKGAKLRVVPINDDGELHPRRAREAARRRATKIVAVAHVSNALGTINPVKQDHRAGPPPRRSGADRRRPGGAAPARRRAGARLRFLRLLRPQDVRPDRHRRPLRQGRSSWS